MLTKEQIEKQIKFYKENRLDVFTAKAEAGDLSDDNVISMSFFQGAIAALKDIIEDCD